MSKWCVYGFFQSRDGISGNPICWWHIIVNARYIVYVWRFEILSNHPQLRTYQPKIKSSGIAFLNSYYEKESDCEKIFWKFYFILSIIIRLCLEMNVLLLCYSPISHLTTTSGPTLPGQSKNIKKDIKKIKRIKSSKLTIFLHGSLCQVVFILSLIVLI